MNENSPVPASGFFRASQTNTRRSMLFCALGALIGLAIAGYGLFTAAGTTTHTVPPEDVALVNQRPVLRSDFITQLESETGLKFRETSRADRLKVLDEMVREELLVQRSLELDFAETDQDTRNALVNVITQQATVDAATTEPTEQQLRDYYQQHQEKYSSDGIMTVRNLILPTAASQSAPQAMLKAQAAVSALRAGTRPEELIAHSGWIEAHRNDADYYFAAKYHLGDALFDRVKDLPDGQISAPVPAADGIHVVQMVKNLRPVPLSFEASHAQVSADYKDSTQTRLLEATMKFLRDKAKILIAPDYVHDYKP
jgi:parvulin-like peptidyl-prolyl isomerase